jgi:hypothetical protein
MLEFLLVDNPAHPGEYFPRGSGTRFEDRPACLMSGARRDERRMVQPS